MTVTELEIKSHRRNEEKKAIRNNEPLEAKLNVIAVISNPCLYVKRYTLFQEFVKRMEEEENVVLYVVEMIYPNQAFAMTDPNNPKHLQVQSQVPIWHKENMIDLGVKLLPKDYKAFAWVDADVEFESSSWALDALKILNGSKDVVQLFSHCVDMDKDETTMTVFNGFGYAHCKGQKYVTHGKDYWHPGYAWAMTRRAYEQVGLYDRGILGSGDSIMAMSFVNRVESMQNPNYHADYNASMVEYQKKACLLRLGYVPTVIRHFFHGTKADRRYTERWKILMEHKFSPYQHLAYDQQGVLVGTISKEFQDAIMTYFWQRREDN